uniref:Uncharacterized protein n=1 Tax=Davidia involucrata TaxID=16924 RepID=A0A5B7CB19_DAVIN
MSGEVALPVVELQEKMKTVGKDEASQAGGGRNPAVSASNEIEPEDCVTPVSLTVNGREQWLQSIWSHGMKRMARDGKSPKIPKVPEKLRVETDFKSYYEPSAVSIGPYHCDKPKFQQMEKVKIVTAYLFLTRLAGKMEDVEDVTRLAEDVKVGPVVWTCPNSNSNSSQVYELPKPRQYVTPDVQLLNKFAEEIKKLKDWYDVDSTHRINEEEEFIQMMFLDGCFIIVFIISILNSLVGELGMTKDTINLVQRDILMLENQLPFPVLEALFGIIGSDKSDLYWMLNRYIWYSIIGSKHYVKSGIRFGDEHTNPSHLLDLLQRLWVPNFEKQYSTTTSSSSTSHGIKLNTDENSCFLVRNMKELTATGVSLSPNSSNLLGDIHFSFFLFGSLKIPPIIMDDATKTIFLNAIAHEAGTENESVFTSYVNFLDSLIDDAEDVKVMVSAGVLENYLGGDEEVANFFNKIGAVLRPEFDAYIGVKMKMRKYSASKRIKVATWLAEVKRDHFRNPWTSIAVLAGFLALLLTFVQTYFTIYPRSARFN